MVHAQSPPLRNFNQEIQGKVCDQRRIVQNFGQPPQLAVSNQQLEDVGGGQA